MAPYAFSDRYMKPRHAVPSITAAEGMRRAESTRLQQLNAYKSPFSARPSMPQYHFPCQPPAAIVPTQKPVFKSQFPALPPAAPYQSPYAQLAAVDPSRKRARLQLVNDVEEETVPALANLPQNRIEEAEPRGDIRARVEGGIAGVMANYPWKNWHVAGNKPCIDPEERMSAQERWKKLRGEEKETEE